MYDYIIVGAGSAGAVLAARLSENPAVSVCLVEAGGPDAAEDIHVPVGFARLFRTSFDWDHDTHEEPELGRRRVYLGHGRVLGGSSATNNMIYVRGNRLDFDAWEQPGWSYADLEPAFLEAEDNERGESEFHGVGGLLRVSDGRSHNPMCAAFVEAACQAGHKRNDDFNGAEQDGFGEFQVTQRDGRRESTATAYLRPATGRPNLTVETNLEVHRVLIEDGRAVGVAGERFGEEVVIRADHEVVVSAGAYNSPKLLQLSGIGPAPLLGALGIEVVMDLPAVGANLQDHAMIPLVFTHDEPISLLAAGAPHNVAEYVESASGPLTSNGPEAGGFVRTDPRLPAPDVELLAAPVMFTDGGLGVPTGHAVSFGPSMLTPRSRGVVMIASPHPSAKPMILHNYFSDPADLAVAVEGVRIALEISRQPALEPYTTTPFRVPASDSDADVEAFVRAYAHSTYHPVGTCAIGSVVDATLQVQGVAGLRVVDASIMPTIVRGNPNAAVIAIAERAAELIVRDRR